MYIYRLTNILNNKVYIGLTKKLPKYRLSEHKTEAFRRNSPHAIHCAIRKYGIDSFSFDVIYQVITNNRQDLIDAEIYFIKEYDCCVLDGNTKGYNMTRGGQFMDSEQASLNNKRQLENGTHYLLSERAVRMRKEISDNRIAEGTHNFQGEEASKLASKRNLDRVKNGTNPFAGKLGRENNLKRIENGTHNWTIERTCPHCQLTGKGNNMLRYHFDNCKKLPLDT